MRIKKIESDFILVFMGQCLPQANYNKLQYATDESFPDPSP